MLKARLDSLRTSLEALKTTSRLCNVPVGATYLERTNAFVRKRQDAWSMKTERFQYSEPVFIEKPPKAMNLAELRELIKYDTTRKNTKFRFVSQNPQHDLETMSPMLRRLFNNGMYYTTFYNHPELLKTLNFEGGRKEIPTQIYLSELITSPEEPPKYREVTESPKPIKVMVKINDEKQTLKVPSLSLLTKMKGIGIPKNHKKHDSLTGTVIDHPLQTGELIKFHTLPETPTPTLVALLPTYILEHRSYFPPSLPYTAPGKLMFEEKEYTHTELSTLLAERLDITPPLFTVIPCIVERTYSKGPAVSENRDGEEVLRQDRFFTLHASTNNAKTRMLIDQQPTVMSKREWPFHRINSGLVYEMLNLNPREGRLSRPEDGNITADMIRAVCLQYETISMDKLMEQKLTLELLNGVMEYYDSLAQAGVKREFENRLEPLAVEVEDKELVRDYFELVNGEKSMAEFAECLVKYIAYTEAKISMLEDKTERQASVKKFLDNLIIRLLQDPARYLFPEFSRMWLNELLLWGKELTLAKKGDTKNPWANYITYEMEKVEITESKKDVLEVVSNMHSLLKFAPPFNWHLEVLESEQIIKDMPLLEELSKEFNMPITVVKELGADEKRVYSSIHDFTLVWPYRPMVDFGTINEESSVWYEHMANLDMNIQRKTIAKLQASVKASLRGQDDHFLMNKERQQLNGMIKQVIARQFRAYIPVFEQFKKERGEKKLVLSEKFKEVEKVDENEFMT